MTFFADLKYNRGMNPVSFAATYIGWHYGRAFLFIYDMWKGAIGYAERLFPIGELLRTLFSPIMRLQESYYKEGKFDIAEYLSVKTVNVIMRLVGAVVRLVIIAVGLAVSLAVFAAGVAFYLFWLVMPAVVVVSIIAGVRLLV